MTAIRVGTTTGLFRLDPWPELTHIEPIRAFSGDYVLVEGFGVQKGVAATDDYVEVPGATSLLWTGRELLAGTAGAHLVRVGLDGAGVERVESFDRAPGRDRWYTPFGAPPEVRSMAVDGEGTLYVNVHVGGILRSSDGGRSWTPTIDIDVDVHQVITVAGQPGRVLAATARGLADSDDYGRKWRIVDDGLLAPYARAVAATDDMVLLSASEGPSGKMAIVYRRPLSGSRRFGRCRGGLLEIFPTNVDTHCIAARGRTVVVGSPDGTIYTSSDSGLKWTKVVSGLPPVRCVLLEDG